MRIGKLRMFFILNGIIALILFIYLGRWLFSEPTTASVTLPFSANTFTATYSVNGNVYRNTFLRNDVPYAATSVKIRYLPVDPSVSRVSSFYGIYAESLGWWLVLLFALSMVLLTNNMIFSKGTVFEFRRKFPWVSMEEYFPVRIIHRRRRKDANQGEWQQHKKQRPKYLE